MIIKMLKLILLCAFLLLSCNVVIAETIKQTGFEYSLKKHPSWVKPQTFAQNMQSESDSGASWLLSDTQIMLSDPDYSRFSHYAVKVNLENGLKEASELNIFFQPQFQSLDINFIKRYRNNKVVDIARQVDINLLRREESYSQGIYDGGVSAMILINDVQVGDIIEYGYTIKGRNPIFEQEYFTGFAVNWNVPVGKMFAKVFSDKKLNYRVSGSQLDLMQKFEEDKFNVYLWEEEKTKAVYDDGEYPFWFQPYGVVRFSEHDSWADIVRWAEKLYQQPKIINKELLALSDKWISESRDKKEYAEKVIRYAQNNIRYFGIEIGQNSHRPFSPDEVFARKFGDCKDKTMFINTLLARQGIEAFPALVSLQNRSGIKERLPQPGVFDHVISTFKIDGKSYWIDGTRQLQYGDLDHIGITNFKQALVIKDGINQLTEIDADIKTDKVTLKEVFVSDSYKKPVVLNARFEYQFDHAESMRYFLKSEGIDNFSKSFVNFYSKQFPAIQLAKDLDLVDDEKLNKFVVNAKFEIVDFWKHEQEKFEVALYGDMIADYVRKPSVVSRRSPLANLHPVSLEHSVTLKHNDQINWDIPDKTFSVSSDEMNYSRNIDFADNFITVKHQYESKKDYIEIEKVATHVESVKKIREALFYSVYIDNVEQASSSSSNLKSVVKALLKKNRS